MERKAIGWDSLKPERRSTPEKPLVAVDDNQHRDPQLDNMLEWETSDQSVLKEMFSSNLSSQGLGIYVEEKAEKTVRATGGRWRQRNSAFRHNSPGAHMNTQTPWLHTQDPHSFRLDREGGGWTQSPAPAKKPFAMIPAGKGKFSVMEHPSACQPHSRAGPRSRSSWPAQKELHVFMCFLLCVCICCLIFCLLVLIFIFCGIFREIKIMKLDG